MSRRMPIIESPVGSDVDVAVIGAGAAGLASAARLKSKRPDLDVLVFEAGQRIGGRAHTLAPPGAGVPLDLGCGWLHGARTNAWTRIAGDLGFAVDRTPAPWDGGGRELGPSSRDRIECDEAVERFFARAGNWPSEAEDRALADLLEAGGPWNGVIGAIGTYINGAELSCASVRDYQRYDPGPGPDWRVLDGYGRLIEAFGVRAPVALGTRVARIDHSGRDRITLKTTAGDSTAKAVVVTVSTALIAEGAIGFDPPLPDKTEAAAQLPLGLADKLFLSAGRPADLPRDGHLLGSPNRTGTGSYQIRPSGRPVIEAYFAGHLAHDLERAGQAAAVAFAEEELAKHFGFKLRGRLSPLAFSGWRADPLFRGSYSYARPGGADRRAVLAAPVDGRLFFAGEACSPRAFSTAHGAFESGITAADAVLAALKRPWPATNTAQLRSDP